MIIKRAIITSGPTREWIDPVRFVSNASSGKMGYCLALELSQWLEEVIYIHGPISQSYIPKNAKSYYTETTIEMLEAIHSQIEDQTLLVMAAAPADFKPIKQSSEKIKKSNSSHLNIELEPNPDILKNIKERISAQNYKNTFFVGFAAETNDLEVNALKKLESKGLDLIIGNYVHKNTVGFGDIESSLHIYSKNGLVLELQKNTKEFLAKQISLFIKEQIK